MNEELTPNERAMVIRNLQRNVERDYQPEPDDPCVNGYICQVCGHVAFTIDTAEGTTPMAIPCTHAPGEDGNILGMDGTPMIKKTHCKGHMASSFYAVKPTDYDMSEVEFEWRSPSLDLFNKFRRERSPLMDHLLQGGLVLCKRDVESPIRLHSGEFKHPDGHILTGEEMVFHRSQVEKLRQGMVIYKIARAKAAKDRENRITAKRDKTRAARKAKNKQAKRNRRVK